MASALQDLGLIEVKDVEARELLLEAEVGDHLRFQIDEARFGGYLWYISELVGGTVMVSTSIVEQARRQVNVITYGEGTSRFRLREARPFSPGEALHELIVQITVLPKR